MEEATENSKYRSDAGGSACATGFRLSSDAGVMLAGKEFYQMKITGIVTSIALLACSAIAAERSVKMKDLPAPVQKTVQEQTKNAELKGLSKEVENGKTFYEAETRVNGKSRDILIDPTGAVVEVEEETTLDSVPAPVKATLEKAAQTGKILKVETVTKGNAVSYEAVVSKNGKKSEVAVDADGTIKK
jgi:uncharacterized membrane protein YkoI